MKKLLFTLFCITSLVTSRGYAQAVQVNFDKKVIYCDSLNMPVNTSAYELMSLLPELLQRPGSMLLSNYEMKVEGMSINQGKDVALANLVIDDIEKIEVDESPMSSYLKNGTSGSINVVLRKHGRNGDKIWGNATVSGSYPMDIAPQLLLAHRSEKFMVHGLLLGDVYNNSTSVENLRYDDNGAFKSNSLKESDIRYRTQLARAYLQFTPTKKDEIKLRFSETYTYNRSNNTPNHKDEMTENQRSKVTQLHALASYNHKFTPRTSLLFEAQYIYNPQTTHNFYPEVQLLDRDSKTNTAAGKVNFTTALLPKESKAALKLVTGSSFNGTFTKNTTDSYYYSYKTPYNAEQNYNTFFAQPFLRLELKAGKLRAKIEGQFQHYRYNLTNPGLDNTIAESGNSTVTSNDFTGKFVGEYHFTPHKNLRLFLNRAIKRPSATQVNYMPDFDAQYSYFVIGNNGLVPSLSHEVRLDYVTDYKWGMRGLTLDASVSYNNVNNIIREKKIGVYEALPGVNLNCVSYENDGRNHIVSGNLMAMYTYKAITLSFAGNVYHNEQRLADSNDHFTYYNLSLYGQFRLTSGWQGSANVAYYSKVKRTNATLSDCAISTISITKAINRHLSAFVFSKIVMQRKAKDTTTAKDGSYSIRCYDMATNTVGLGIRYGF